MSDRMHRRGLGRGLGSLIPTGPRPEPEAEPETPVAAEGRSTSTLTRPASADWIGVPLPGDDTSGPHERAEADDQDMTGTGHDAGTLPEGDGDGDSSEATVEGDDLGSLTEESPDEEPLIEESEAVAEPPTSTDAPDDVDVATDAPGGGVGEVGAGRSTLVDETDGAPAADSRLVATVAEGVEGVDGVDGVDSADHPGPDPLRHSGDLRQVEGAYFAHLPVTAIRPNPRQPREVFDEDAMAELVQSVQQVGLLQPVVVRDAGDGEFELVMGERRWRATRDAGLDVIPAIVRETGDDALLRDALLENLHRAELNALEEAAAYQQLLEDFGCTHDELASRIGRSRPQISNTIRLLKLSPTVQRRVAAGVLSAGHARALLGVEDSAVQDRLAARVVAEGISVRALEEIVAVGELGDSPGRRTPRSRPTAPGVEDLAARLSDRLETRVQVNLGRRKGRITVEFASLPDLERIVAVIDPDHPHRTRHDA